MTIRPIDYVNIISKAQEIAKIRQTEHNKTSMQVEQAVLEQKVKVKQRQKKVRDTNKGEKLAIDKKRREQSGNSNNKEGNNKKKKKGKKESIRLGGNIDLKI